MATQREINIILRMQNQATAALAKAKADFASMSSAGAAAAAKVGEAFTRMDAAQQRYASGQGNAGRASERTASALLSEAGAMQRNEAAQQRLTAAKEKFAAASKAAAAAETTAQTAPTAGNQQAAVTANERLEAALKQRVAAERSAATADIALRSASQSTVSAMNAEAEAASKLNAALESSHVNLQKFGTGLQSIGQSMTIGVTAPILAGIGGIIKAGSSYETAFAGVKRTNYDASLSVEQNAKAFNTLDMGIQAMALKLPATREEIAGVAEVAGQLGLKQSDIISFSEAMIRMGASSDMSAATAAEAFARLGNVLGETTGPGIARLASVTAELGITSAATESEITAMAFRIAGAGKVAGFTNAQILAMAASAASLGIKADLGGSSLSRVITEMSKSVELGGEKLEAFAKVSGMTAEQFSAQWKQDPQVAMQAFIEGLSKLQDTGGGVFTTLSDLGLDSIRVSTTILRAAQNTDIWKRSLETANAEMKSNHALIDISNRKFDTLGSQFQILKNRVSAVALVLYQAWRPALEQALNGVSGLVTGIGHMAQAFSSIGTGPLTAVLGALLGLAAVGPILLGVSGALIGLSAVAGALPEVLLGVTVGVGSVAAGFGIILLAAAALGAGLIILVTHWDQLKAMVPNISSALGALAGVLGPVVGAAFEALATVAEAAIKDIIAAIAILVIAIDHLVGLAARPIVFTVVLVKKIADSGTASDAKGFFGGIVDDILNAPKAFQDATDKAISDIKDTTQGFGGQALQKLGIFDVFQQTQNMFDTQGPLLDDSAKKWDQLAHAAEYAGIREEMAGQRGNYAANQQAQGLSTAARYAAQAAADQQTMSDTLTQALAHATDGGLSLAGVMAGQVTTGTLRAYEAVKVFTNTGKVSFEDFMKTLDSLRTKTEGDILGLNLADEKDAAKLAPLRAQLDAINQMMDNARHNVEEFKRVFDGGLVAQDFGDKLVATAAQPIQRYEGIISNVKTALGYLDDEYKSGAINADEYAAKVELLNHVQGRAEGGIRDSTAAYIDSVIAQGNVLDSIDALNAAYASDHDLKKWQAGMDALGASLDPVTAANAGIRDSLAGLTPVIADMIGQIHNLGVDMGLLPDAKVITISMKTEGIEQAKSALAGAIGNIANGGGGVGGEHKLDMLENKLSIAMDVNVGDAVSTLDTFKTEHLQNLNTPENKAEITANADPALGVIDGLKTQLAALTGQTYTVNITPIGGFVPPGPSGPSGNDFGGGGGGDVGSGGGGAPPPITNPGQPNAFRHLDSILPAPGAVENLGSRARELPKQAASVQDSVGTFVDILKGIVQSLADAGASMGDSVKSAKEFADAGKSGIETILAALDLMDKLSGRTIVYTDSLAANIENLKFTTEKVVVSMGDSAALFSSDYLKATKEYSDTGKSGIETLVAALDFITKMGDKTILYGQWQADNIANLKFITEKIVQSLGDAANLMSTEFITHAKDFADSGKTGAEALSSVLDLMAKLGDQQVRWGEWQAKNIANLKFIIEDIVASLGDAAALMSTDFVTNAKNFADSGKAGADALMSGLDFIAKLGDTVVLWGDWQKKNIANLKFIIEDIVKSLGDAAALMTGPFVQAEKDFADAASASVGVLSATLDLLVKLSDKTSQAALHMTSIGSDIDMLAHDTLTIVNAMRAVDPLWGDVIYGQMKSFADAVSSSVGALSSTLDLLQKFHADGARASITSAQIADDVTKLADDSKLIADAFYAVMSSWAKEDNTAVPAQIQAFADAVSASAGALGNTLDFLGKIAGGSAAFKVPSSQIVDNVNALAADSVIIEKAFEAVLAKWALDGDTTIPAAITAFATAVGDSTKALSTTLDFLSALAGAADGVTLSQEQIAAGAQTIAGDALTIAQAFAAASLNWDKEAFPALSDFATAVTDSAGALDAVAKAYESFFIIGMGGISDRGAQAFADNLSRFISIILKAVQQAKNDWQGEAIKDLGEWASSAGQSVGIVGQVADAMDKIAHISRISAGKVAIFSSNFHVILGLVRSLNAMAKGYLADALSFQQIAEAIAAALNAAASAIQAVAGNTASGTATNQSSNLGGGSSSSRQAYQHTTTFDEFIAKLLQISTGTNQEKDSNGTNHIFQSVDISLLNDAIKQLADEKFGKQDDKKNPKGGLEGTFADELLKIQQIGFDNKKTFDPDVLKHLAEILKTQLGDLGATSGEAIGGAILRSLGLTDEALKGLGLSDEEIKKLQVSLAEAKDPTTAAVAAADTANQAGINKAAPHHAAVHVNTDHIAANSGAAVSALGSLGAATGMLGTDMANLYTASTSVFFPAMIGQTAATVAGLGTVEGAVTAGAAAIVAAITGAAAAAASANGAVADASSSSMAASTAVPTAGDESLGGPSLAHHHMLGTSHGNRPIIIGKPDNGTREIHVHVHTTNPYTGREMEEVVVATLDKIDRGRF